MYLTYLHEFLAIALIHFLAVALPGPDLIMTVQQSIRYGRSSGIYTALGIGTGISIHVMYTLVGIGALMHTTPWLFNTVKIIGGIYILYLGIQLIRSRSSTLTISATSDQTEVSQTRFKSFTIGFMTNATNPKATLFFLAIFTTVVSGTTPIFVQLFYGIWMCIATALWFILVSILFSNTSIRQRFLRMGSKFEKVMGAVLILFAIRLVWSMFG